jgi:uncharacterized membrane protein (UPF0127 family)
MKIINVSKGTILADKAELANTFFKRLLGLLNRKSLNKGEALILSPSNCIHSFFMRFSIDALFLDQSGKVTATLSSFRSFRVSPIYFNSSLTIEFPESTLQSSNTQPGDIIKITPD